MISGGESGSGPVDSGETSSLDIELKRHLLLCIEVTVGSRGPMRSLSK